MFHAKWRERQARRNVDTIALAQKAALYIAEHQELEEMKVNRLSVSLSRQASAPKKSTTALDSLKNLVHQFRSFKPKKTSGLDLSYIPSNETLTESRIIAMCTPSDGGVKGALLRNDADDVATFLNSAHGTHYRIYNLKEKPHSEKMKKKFLGSFRHCPMADHEAPMLTQLHAFCQDADKFLKEDVRNVIVIHCKAGKGRTGTCICCYLLYSGAFKDADTANSMYAQYRSEAMVKTIMRGNKETKEIVYRGVDQPSQVRWIRYFQQCLADGPKAFARLDTISRRIKSVLMFTTPDFDVSGGCNPYIVLRGWGLKKDGGGERLLEQRECICFDAHVNCPPESLPIYQFDCGSLSVTGETKLEIWDEDTLFDDAMCRIWIHPAMVAGDMLELGKSEIDDAWSSNNFSPHFKVIIQFEPVV